MNIMRFFDFVIEYFKQQIKKKMKTTLKDLPQENIATSAKLNTEINDNYNELLNLRTTLLHMQFLHASLN